MKKGRKHKKYEKYESSKYSRTFLGTSFLLPLPKNILRNACGINGIRVVPAAQRA